MLCSLNGFDLHQHQEAERDKGAGDRRKNKGGQGSKLRLGQDTSIFRIEDLVPHTERSRALAIPPDWSIFIHCAHSKNAFHTGLLRTVFQIQLGVRG